MNTKNRTIRILSLCAAIVLVSASVLLCSCNSKPKPIGNDVPIELPLAQERTLTYWTAFDSTYMPDYTTYADHPFFIWMKEKTNINVEFWIPNCASMSIDDTRNAWMTVLATGDMPDIHSPNWFVPDLTGSTIDSAAEEEMYYILNDYVDIQMPNFNALREEYGIIDKLMITAYGNIMYIPGLTGLDKPGGNAAAPNTAGMVIRKDFLDEAQLDVPVTIADWDKTLEAFQLLGVANPMYTNEMVLTCGVTGEAFISCYGNGIGLYIDEDGILQTGNGSEAMRKYVAKMAEWYEKGYIAIDNINTALKASDDVGCWAGDINDIANMKAQSTNPNYELVAAPDPVLNVGDKITVRGDYMPIGNREINCIYVTYSCDSPALACKWIDQMFTEEAYLRSSYGAEGDTYTVEGDGSYKFTDKVLKAEGGALAGVTQQCYTGSLWHDRDILVDMTYGDDVKAAVATWSLATSERNIIRGTSLTYTTEESDALKVIDGSINIAMWWRVRDNMIKTNDMTYWDTYVTSINEGGIEEQVLINRASWERFLAN